MNQSAKKIVMIVDDAPDNLLLLDMMLDDEFDVVQARSGEECLTIIDRQIPDILLLDVNMPGMSGYEVCRILRERSSTKSLPIIFISAMLTSEERAEGFNVGGNEYLNKPVNAKELLNKIQYQLAIVEFK